jgi:hypothetical protein
VLALEVAFDKDCQRSILSMKGEVLLPKVSLRGFPPRTYGADDIPKKAEVRDRMKARIPDLGELQRRCRGKRLYLDVTFYLYRRSTLEGRAGKDLDNLLKIVLDAMPEYMDRAHREQGLGLAPGSNDDMVFELHAAKSLVDSEPEEGIDIEVSEWVG